MKVCLRGLRALTVPKQNEIKTKRNECARQTVYPAGVVAHEFGHRGAIRMNNETVGTLDETMGNINSNEDE